LKALLDVIGTSVSAFQRDGCDRMAAAISYYAVFSLPGLMVVMVTLAGLVWDAQDLEGRVGRGLRMVVGNVGAEQITMIVSQANRPNGSVWGTLLATGIMLLGATGVMVQIQRSLNEIWRVMPRPGANPLRLFFVKRTISLAIVLSFAMLLLVSLILSASISAFGRHLESTMPGSISDNVLAWTNALIAYVIVTAMFAVTFRYLPDVRLRWTDVFVGANVTSLLFSLGKGILAIYLARSNVGSVYGAAGSLALILVWVYYSSMIFLFGAQFTRTWTRARRGAARPRRGAVRDTRFVDSASPMPNPPSS